MQRRISTGVPGLDDVLNGGLTLDRLYLLQGRPGAGKTTLGGILTGVPIYDPSHSDLDANG